MGLADRVPAWTLNQACASGLQAVASAAQAIAAGDAEIVLAGGIESMSRMPYLIDADDARWGHKMGHFPLVDAMYRDGFQCSLSGLIMGETAELLARDYGITREASDEYALLSQQRAEAATRDGTFRRRDRAGPRARAERRDDDRRRRASEARDDDRGAGETAARVSGGRRACPASSRQVPRPASPTAAPP